MPTGFEAAGLALAIFPVLIEGLKFYAEEEGVIKDFLRYRYVFKQIRRDLAREQTIFRMSCQRFLEDLAPKSGLGEIEVSEMMEDPQDPRWSRPDQKGILEQDSVQRYLEAVEDMKEELFKIQKWSRIRADAPPKVLDGRINRRRQFFNAASLAIRKDEIKDHLRRAGQLNRFLTLLTEQTQPTVVARRGCRKKSTKHYERIRSHAMDLYDILQTKLQTPLTCNCARQHDINFRLEFRSAYRTAQGLSFHVIFSFETAESKTKMHAPWNWREIEIEPWKGIFDNMIVANTQDGLQSAVETPRKNVTFLLEPQTTALGDEMNQEIVNLCGTLALPITSTDWIGVISNKQGCKHRMRAVDGDKKLSAYNVLTVSLARVLEDKAFRREHRARLGLKLASSVMQLHATEWLMDFWSKDDILFIQSLGGTVNFDNPLIRRSFGSKTGLCSPVSETPKSASNRSIPCLFSLGVVLIELWFKQDFKDMKSDGEKAVPRHLSDLMTADRLIKDMDAGPHHNSVVSMCISGTDAAYTSLMEDRFRNEVEDKIIFPLEENLKFYCGKNSVQECF